MAALGAATQWAIEQFAISAEEPNGKLPEVQANAWNLSPSVGTWLLLKPKMVAPSTIAETVSAMKTSTPSKVQRATGGPSKSPAKAVSSKDKVEVRRSPRRTAPAITTSVKGNDQVQAIPEQASKLAVASAKTSSKSSATSSAPKAVRQESIRQPQLEKCSTSKGSNAAVPEVLDDVNNKAPLKPAGNVPPCAPTSPCPKASAAKSPAVLRAKSPAAARAKSPAAARAKSPANKLDGLSTATTAASASKAMSSADIEAQKIAEKRKQAKLIADRNARRMHRSAPVKAVESPAPPSEAPAKAHQAKQRAHSPAEKASSLGAEKVKADSTLSKSVSAKAFRGAGGPAARAKAVVAAAPTPAKNAGASPRPRPQTPARADASSRVAVKRAPSPQVKADSTLSKSVSAKVVGNASAAAKTA